MTLIDWSGGLSPEKEKSTLTAPTEPFWCENLLFCPYDPKSDIGMWLHLGTVPNDWYLWEDRVMIALPGDEGMLSMWAYYPTATENKPAGANLKMRCLEPFRRWSVSFDGFADYISKEELNRGGLAAPSSRRRRLVIELETEMVCPVWDAQSRAHSAEGKGDMTTQGWAKEHYEQMYRAKGTVRLDDKTYPFDGMGWRDHSRGPRGGGTGQPWGGHVIAGGVWPSGRSAIFSCYWRPDGLITLEGAQVTEKDGTTRSATFIDPPRVNALIFRDEVLKTTLKHADGEARLTLTTDKSMWTSMPMQQAVGIDRSGTGLTYVLNYGKAEWDGEVGSFYIERSDPLSLPPIALKAAE